MIKAANGYLRNNPSGDRGGTFSPAGKKSVFRKNSAFKLTPSWGRLLLASALVLGASTFFLPAYADSSADLDRLEQKFFQHSYAKEDLPVRLGRLEKMVFGESKTGSDPERLLNLVKAVPANSGQPSSDGDDTASSGNRESAPETANRTPTRPARQPVAPPSSDQDDAQVPNDEKYPAVSAIEQKVFGHDFAQEPIGKRLSRLETKEFGKPSTSTDLSDRVDALKSHSGIDITQQRPRGSEWSDEDDDDMTSPPPVARNRGGNGGGSYGNGNYGSSPGADGMSFSGRNLRQDMNQAFGSSAGSGSYGFGGSGMGMGAGLIDPNSSSSSYGAPPAYGRPRYPSNQGYGGANQSYGGQGYAGGGYRPSAPPAVSDNGMGLTQQISALESSVFGKNYRDPLPERLSRLEATVFPQEKPADDMGLPDRVARLAAVIPIDNTMNQNRRLAQRPDSYDPDAGMSQQQQRQRNAGGLSKIMNSLSGMFGGGMTGGYAMQPGTLMTDPQTGNLIDPTTGNLIDPNTGAVVGRRTTGSYGGYSPYSSAYGTGMGMGTGMGFGMGGFNNGFSPYGMMPYGGGYNRGLGIGVGGLGGGRGFGFWP